MHRLPFRPGHGPPLARNIDGQGSGFRCQRSRSAMQRCQSFSRLAVGFGWGTTWSALLSVLGSAALPTRGVGTSIPDSAGGLRAVGLSFIGLSGLESGMLPSNPALCDLSNAICCCCCAPPRRYPGSCRTHHHHPSPGHSLTSISSLLTRPLPSLCAISAGLVRRLERPLWRRQDGCPDGGSSGDDSRSVCVGGAAGLTARTRGGGCASCRLRQRIVFV